MPLPPPNVGDWYESTNGDLFEVVAIDSDEGTIEIQYFDGTLEELDFEAWEESDYVTALPPEDYSGSLDIEKEDYGVDLERPGKNDWADPLDYLDQSE